jgi:hypothetical protein
VTDITSTSFGLIIAFLLPGLTGLVSLSFWSVSVLRIFQAFLTAESNVGLFLMVVLAALTMGLLITVVRWVLFECWFCRSERLLPADFTSLGRKDKLEAFRAAVDEHYRYHQFWGGMTVALAMFYAGWLHSVPPALQCLTTLWSLVVFLGLEVLMVVAAKAAYRNYVARSKSIMTGG